MIYENPPSPAQLKRLEQDNQPTLLQAQTDDKQTDQDLINALLLQKIAELEAKLASQTSYGDSADM